METAKRRSRFKSAPRGVGRHGEHVSGTPNQLAILQALDSGPLPSTYLRSLLPSQSTALDVVGLLAQEGYIVAPAASTEHLRALSRPTVYERTVLGTRLLLAKGIAACQPPKADSAQYRHAVLSSVVQFSLDAAPRHIPNLKKRTLQDIINDGPPELRHDPFPSVIELDDCKVKADALLFGYEYTRDDGKRSWAYFHGFEADRGTEPLTGKGRQTIELKLRHYKTYLQQKYYRTRYLLPNCRILFVTTMYDRAVGIAELWKEIAPELADRLLVKFLPDPHKFEFPPPTPFMVTEPLLRPGGTTVTILDILKGDPLGQTRASKESVAIITGNPEEGD